MQPFRQWINQRNGQNIELPEKVIMALGELPEKASGQQLVNFELEDGSKLSGVTIVNGNVAVVPNGTVLDPMTIKSVGADNSDPILIASLPDIEDEESGNEEQEVSGDQNTQGDDLGNSEPNAADATGDSTDKDDEI